MKKSRYSATQAKALMMRLGVWLPSGLKPYQGMAYIQMMGRAHRVGHVKSGTLTLTLPVGAGKTCGEGFIHD